MFFLFVFMLKFSLNPKRKQTPLLILVYHNRECFCKKISIFFYFWLKFPKYFSSYCFWLVQVVSFFSPVKTRLKMKFEWCIFFSNFFSSCDLCPLLLYCVDFALVWSRVMLHPWRHSYIPLMYRVFLSSFMMTSLVPLQRPRNVQALFSTDTALLTWLPPQPTQGMYQRVTSPSLKEPHQCRS